MERRGVVYLVWGTQIRSILQRSIDSVRKWHPELPIHVEDLGPGDKTVEGLLEKARVMSFSPFEETLFLDADTVVLGKLDFGFTRARQSGIACAICECPWARRHTGVSGDIVEYNTGVLFFTRDAEPVFRKWEMLAPTLDSSIPVVIDGEVKFMPFADQGSFSQAIHEESWAPSVLPLNWNFRPRWQKSFYGPIRVWHEYNDVPPELIDLNRYYEQPDSLIQFHDLT